MSKEEVIKRINRYLTEMFIADPLKEILNLRYPNGKPMLAILDENQELPVNHLWNKKEYSKEQCIIYDNALLNMSDAGWRKTI